MTRDLSAGEKRALRIIGRVVDNQADEEPNRWYAFLKRRAARRATDVGSRDTKAGEKRLPCSKSQSSKSCGAA